MKVVFFNRSLMSGGIEKCIELLSYYLHQKHEIEIVYSHDDKLDQHIVKILSNYAKITQLKDNIIKCDVCIFCYLYFDYNQIINQIHAKTYFSWIHSEPRALPNCLLDNEDFVNKVSEFICVSNEIKSKLDIKKQGVVIHNFINENIVQLSNQMNPFENYSAETLKLVIVSRLSQGKGFERVKKLVEALERKKVLYKLKIVGKGRAKEQEIRKNLGKYPNVEFVGYKDNPYCYIRNADYLVLLSDYESWGNVITEAKTLHVPCLVTDFPSAKEQIVNNENGIIVQRTLEDYSEVVEKLIERRKILKDNLNSFSYHNEVSKWEEILEKKRKME